MAKTKIFSKVVLILIALMLSTMQYQATKYACYRSDQRSVVPRIRTFTGDLTTPVIKYRVFSTWIVKQFVFGYAIKAPKSEIAQLKKDIKNTPYGFKLLSGKIDYVAFFEIIAWWMFFWLFVTMLIPIFCSKMPLYWMLALFAATQYHWLPGGRDFVFPYDGPILFMTTLTMLVLHKYMPVAIVAAMSIKETALAMVFTCNTWRKTIVAGIVALSTKAVIDLIVGNPIIFTQEPKIRLQNDMPCVIKNIGLLNDPHVLMMYALIAAGCVFVVNRVRLSVLFYFVCMFIFSITSEHRLWVECLIIILWGIEQKKFGENRELAIK